MFYMKHTTKSYACSVHQVPASVLQTPAIRARVCRPPTPIFVTVFQATTDNTATMVGINNGVQAVATVPHNA